MKNRKIIYIILACIIVIGAIITGFKGLNVSLKYSPNKQIEINLGKEFDKDEIRQIVKDVIGNKEIIIQKVELYEEIVSITVREITDEQVEQINAKLNEKYGTSNEVKDLVITENANLKISDIVKPYIFPIALSLIIIIVYAGIRFRKINIFEVLGKIIGMNILAEALYVSALAITRLEVNIVTIPMAIAIYTLVTFVIFNELENKETKVSSEQKKK